MPHVSKPPSRPETSGSPIRVWIVLGLPVALALAAWWLAARGPSAMPISCTFRELTGLHCAGCGMTRASHAVLEGRFLDAFRLNPLGVVLLPLGAAVLLPEVIGWARGRRPPWRLAFGKRSAIALVAVVFGYTVLRNLPWMPFTLLAPTG